MSGNIFCVKCGHQNPPMNTACTNCGAFLTRAPISPTRKPGKVQVIAILCLVDGILNVIWALLGAIALPEGYFLACYQTPYCLVLGIMELVYAAKLLSNPPRPVRPARYIAILQIINIVTVNALGFVVASTVVGILSLVFYNDVFVLAFFDNLRGQVTGRAELAQPNREES